MPTTAKPDAGTCIVLGVETQIGLAIIRELGQAGVTVIALSPDPHAIGLSSRYVHHFELVEPRSDALIQILNRLGERFGPCSLITVSEANLQWLTRHAHALSPLIRPALPPAEALAKVLDKQRTLAAATQVGIRIPLTEAPGSLEDIERLASTFPFPAVLKWKDAEAVAAALSGKGLPFIKAEYVYSADELRAAGHRYAPLGQWPLVQQYCRGQGLGQFFFMRDGQVLQRFQHLRIAEWPPEGGFSSVCDAVPLSHHQALQEQSVALLRAVGWEGVAMVEYRHDPATGQSVLMEINGRFWGSYPLAMHCGAGFALLAHQVALARDIPPQTPPRDDLRCRMLVTELKRLVRLSLQRGKILDRQYKGGFGSELCRFVTDFLRPRVRYFLWSPRDPRPFFQDGANLVRKVLRRH